MTEVALYEPAALPARAGVPGTQEFDSWVAVCSEVIKLANVIYDTPFVPDGLRGSGPAVAAAILAGRELGLGPMTSLANVHVIKGKPSLSAALMRALILAQGHSWRDIEVTDSRVVIEGKRRNESEWTRVAFTAEQAAKAKIDLGGYPQDKLYARATSRLARRKFADVIAGMAYSAEELEDGAADGVMLADDPGHAAERKAAAEQPQPRTAQRKTRQRAAAAKPAASEPQQHAEPPLPPLPGEDEPDPPTADAGPAATAPAATASAADDDPEPIRDGQLTAIWTLFTKVFAFASDDTDKARARSVCSHVLNRPLESTRDMNKAEASTVMDTLHLWQDIADKQGVTPRSVLEAEMQAGQPGE